MESIRLSKSSNNNNNNVCSSDGLDFINNNSKQFDPGERNLLNNQENNQIIQTDQTQQNESTIDKNTILKTKYKYKKKPIGQGSFATVFLAINKEGQKFALKRIELSKLDPTRIDKFMLELEISQKLVHKNIVKCHDIIKTDCHWFLVNELCDKGTLDGVIKAFAKLDPLQKETYGHHYLTQLKDALCYLHKNNIVHRDLKPKNILIARGNNQDPNNMSSLDEVVKLADFGLARYFEHKPQNTSGYDEMIQTMCGSPIYMAPELILEDVYNIKADLWSFGIIMYEMLYGKNPYNQPRTIVRLAELMKIKTIVFPPTLSPLCIDLLKKLLQVDPTNRIQWEDFGNHEWFSQILVSESEEDTDTTNTTNTANNTNDLNNPDNTNLPDLTTNNTTQNVNDIELNKPKNNNDNNDNKIKTFDVDDDTVVVIRENIPKTIELSEKDRHEAFQRARSMKDTFQLLKDRGRVFSDIKKDPDISPYSSGNIENARKRKGSSTGSIFFEMSENFLDTHFGSDINTDCSDMTDHSDRSDNTDGTNREDHLNSTNKQNKKKIKEYKESVGSSVIRILSESVSFWVSNKGSLT